MVCTRKHIKDPIPEDTWICPKCGDECCLDDPDDDDCSNIHSDDWIICQNIRCGHSEKVTSYFRRYLKEHSQVPCPHCKGTGYIPR
jgi:hypothetical protein